MHTLILLIAMTFAQGVQADDMARCEAALVPFAALAEGLETGLECVDVFTLDGAVYVSEAAGLYFAEDIGRDSLAAVRVHGADKLYYGDVAAHELGHAWQSQVLGQAGIDLVMDIYGLDREAHADVIAYSLGYWRDYGNGWRHPQGPPTQDQITEMRAHGLIPAAGSVHSDRTITNPEGY